MAFMTWSDDLVTGIEVVDRQHRHLVDMINHAAQLLLEAPAAEPEQKTDKLFADLMDYAATHFHTEEALMAARGVDARVLAHHHRTHQDFVQQITSMARQFRAGELNSDGLLGYLAGWLLFHTLGEDQTMSRQVHAIENGVDPARAYQDAEGGRLEPEQNALARTMVTLYTQLSGQIRELDLYSQRLEELVDERTAHLNAMTDDLAKARDAAEAGSRAKSRFIGAISHELRTPMNAVLGLARVLQGAPLQTNQSGLVRNIVDSSEHLLKLINDVIEYARIDSGSDEVQAVSFDLRAGLDEACASGFEVARSKGIDCRLEVDAALPPQCVGDVRRLVSALRQFVDNAAKFTERGAIRVRAERLGAEKDRVQVRFGVRDSGIGIAPEQQNLLFQAFRQLDDSPARKYAGIGLGLALAHHLVQQLGGGIGLKSEPGKGSLFWLDIWLAPGEADARPAPPKAGEREDKPAPKLEPAPTAVDVGKAEAALARIRALLSQDDTEVGAVFESSAALLKPILGAQFDEISRQIAGFEFERALAVLEALEPAAKQLTETPP